jgi:hypothetical protein
MARWNQFVVAGVLGVAAVVSGACSSSSDERVNETSQHLDEGSQEIAAAKAGLDSVLGAKQIFAFTVNDLGDRVEITAKTKVGARTLTLQVALMATGSLHPGEEPAEFIKRLTGGAPEDLTVAFSGDFIGQDADGQQTQVALSEVAAQMLDSTTPTMCGTRTHNAIVDLTALDGETTRAVIGLSVTSPASASDPLSGGGGGIRPMAEAEHQPAPPADGKACPDSKGYGLFIYADPGCGSDRCYNLTWVKQKRMKKAEVEVDGKKVSGSGEAETEVETPVWVAGNCSTEFARWSFPSYYYCKCNTPQLGPPK